MNTSLRRGWCPSLFRPMDTGDGLLSRIKPYLSRITSQEAHFIANAATQYGNGLINLSQKANLQLRGFTQQTARIFIPEAVNAGLASHTCLQEKRRNFLVSPLAGLDPECHPETEDLANRLQRLLNKAGGVDHLSGKFSFVIDGGGLLPLMDCSSDINLRYYKGQWVIQLGQTSKAMPCQAKEAPFLIIRLIKSLIKHNPHRLYRDMKAVHLFKRFGRPLINYKPIIAPLPVSVGPIGKSKPIGIGIGIPFGLIDADALHHLANIAQTHGDGTLRLTPWRSVILPYCSAEILSLFPNMIVNKTDSRLHIITCPGQPFCPRAGTKTLEDASTLAPFYQSSSNLLHISGCPKGCAHPGKTKITLRATHEGYDIILNGTTDSVTPYSRLSLTQISAFLQEQPNFVTIEENINASLCLSS